MSFGKYLYRIPNIHTWPETNNGQGDGQLFIGNFCSFGENVHIYLGGNHRTDWVTTYPFGHIYKDVFYNFDGQGHPATKGDVIIGNDVWIGDNTTIMSGVTIGDGAIVACKSHIVKNVEPYSIVGGNPAKFIKYRFKPEQISKLLEIKWWDWDELTINNFTPLLCNQDIDQFIEEALKLY